MNEEKDSVSMKARRPVTYIKRTVILIVLFSLVYFVFTKITSHNKKENALKATREVKKETVQKQAEQKQAEQPPEVPPQAKEVEQPVQGPPQEINENAKLDEYLKSKNFSGTAVVVKNGKVSAGCELTIKDKEGNSILHEADLFEGQDVFLKENAESLKCTISTGKPMNWEENYNGAVIF